MSVDPSRLRLHQRLQEVLGPEEAETLMAHLPAFNWSEIATQSDVTALRRDVIATQGDVRGVQRDVTSLQRDVTSLQHDVSSLQHDVSSLQHDVSSLQHDVSSVQHDVTSLQHDVRALGNQIVEVEERVGAKIDLLRSQHDHKIDHVGAELKAQIAATDHKIDRVGSDLALQMRSFESELRVEMAGLRADFHSTMRTNTYLVLGGVSALMVAMSTISQIF